MSVDQRAELYTAAGRSGISYYPADAPQRQPGLVLSLCSILLAKRKNQRCFSS